jgi:hypothetical protein
VRSRGVDEEVLSEPGFGGHWVWCLELRSQQSVKARPKGPIVLGIFPGAKAPGFPRFAAGDFR